MNQTQSLRSTTISPTLHNQLIQAHGWCASLEEKFPDLFKELGFQKPLSKAFIPINIIMNRSMIDWDFHPSLLNLKRINQLHIKTGLSHKECIPSALLSLLPTLLHRYFPLPPPEKDTRLSFREESDRYMTMLLNAKKRATDRLLLVAGINPGALRRIDLSNCGLTMIPALHGCSQLYSLNISKNKITFLGNCDYPPSIEAIDLSQNPLCACIDLAQLAQRVQQALGMDKNSRTIVSRLVQLLNPMGQPSELSDMESFLHLCNTHFIKQLETVTILDLSSSRLKALPLLIFQKLPNLRVLDLRHGKIAALPEGLQLTKLERLYLADNRISSFPQEHELPSLRLLDLTNNSLTAVPELKLPQLKVLRLGLNRIATLPQNLLPLLQLEELSLIGNPIQDFSKRLKELSPSHYERARSLLAIDTTFDLWNILVEEFIHECWRSDAITLPLPKEPEEVENYLFSPPQQGSNFAAVQFFFETLGKADHLSFAGCNLTQVPTALLSAFDTINNFPLLDLSDNRISRLPMDFGLECRKIILDDNRIQTIEENIYNPSLREISLKNNLIEKLPNNYLLNIKNVAEIAKIDLGYNTLKEFPTIIFSQRTADWKLFHKFFQLEGNPLRDLSNITIEEAQDLLPIHKKARIADEEEDKPLFGIHLPDELLNPILYWSIDSSFYFTNRKTLNMTVFEAHREDRVGRLVRACGERLLVANQCHLKDLFSFPKKSHSLSFQTIFARTNFYNLRRVRCSLQKFCKLSKDVLISDERLSNYAKNHFIEHYVTPLSPIIHKLSSQDEPHPEADPEIGNPPRPLHTLNLSEKKLETLVISPFWQMVNVTKLDLSKNLFTCLKSFPLDRFKWIKILDLSHNQIEEAILSSTALETLRLNDNRIKRLDIRRCSELLRLILSNNQFTSLANLQLARRHVIAKIELQNNQIKTGVKEFLVSMERKNIAAPLQFNLLGNPLEEQIDAMILAATAQGISFTN